WAAARRTCGSTNARDCSNRTEPPLARVGTAPTTWTASAASGNCSPTASTSPASPWCSNSKPRTHACGPILTMGSCTATADGVGNHAGAAQPHSRRYGSETSAALSGAAGSEIGVGFGPKPGGYAREHFIEEV